MPIRDELLSLLRCPLTRSPLHLADPELVRRLNELIGEGKLENRAGDKVGPPLEAGLVDTSGEWLYPVWDGIPTLLKDEAIPISGIISSETIRSIGANANPTATPSP